tara:strand:- start:5727 stop:7490 length:1764 start_codon:yes stop_codon:yes gene_type:complete
MSVFLGLLVWNPSPFQILELKVFDYLIMSTPEVQNENILIVDLDEEIVEAYGGYPLPRDLYAAIIGNTSAVPGITVLMPDPDLRNPLNDQKLASVMQKVPTVLASAVSNQSEEQGPHVGTAQLGEDPTPWLFKYPGVIRTEKHLALTREGAGIVTATPEIDGVTRRVPLVYNVQNKLYPSFALELLRVGVGDPSYQLRTGIAGIESVRIPNYPTITTDPYSRIFLNWNTKFYRQSASDFMKAPIEAPFIIVGVTAEGVVNPVATPAGSMMPHELQANLLHNLIEGTSPSIPTWNVTVELGAAVLALLLILLASRSVYFSLPMIIIVVGGSIYAVLEAYKSSYLLDLSGVVIISILFWSIVTFKSFITEYLQKLRIKQQFGTYVSPDLVKKLQEDPSLLRLGGFTEQLTFLFSDIRGFTPISEKYQKDPQGLTRLINRFLDNQTEIILKHGGTIDKYMGDCIMAFWGAPLPDENHIENATKAAIEMRIALEKLNETLKEEGLDQINTGAGINSGPCVVGNFGSSTRFDYSVLGDAVNLAARLESSCKEYDADLIISEHSLVDGYDYEFLDEVTVKGKSEPVKIYTIRK